MLSPALRALASALWMGMDQASKLAFSTWHWRAGQRRWCLAKACSILSFHEKWALLLIPRLGPVSWMPALVGQKILSCFTLLLLIIQEKFQLASRSYTIIWHFTSFLILPHSDMLKFSSCKQFLTGQQLQTNQGGHPLYEPLLNVCGYHESHPQ